MSGSRIIPKAEDGPWMVDAACSRLPSSEADRIFFPSGKTGGTRLAIQEAKEVCRGCAVREECLNHALAHRERFGVWGGKTERERRRIAKARRSA